MQLDRLKRIELCSHVCTMYTVHVVHWELGNWILYDILFYVCLDLTVFWIDLTISVFDRILYVSDCILSVF